jgi:hypothetical protein
VAFAELAGDGGERAYRKRSSDALV